MMRSLFRIWQKQRLKDARFQELFAPATPEEWVCFDCETTGLNPKKDRIVTLSAIKIRGRKILTSDALNLVIRQEAPVSADSIKVHHLRQQDLKDGISEKEAMERFLHFIEGQPLVGYYLEFDVAMVNQAIQPWLGIKLPNQQIEISELFYDATHHPFLPKSVDLSFEHILKTLDVPNLGQHDAFNDALMTALCFLKLQSSALSQKTMRSNENSK